MGYLDEVKVLVGRGVDVADRRTQELHIQAELNRLAAAEKQELAVLGHAVYNHPTLSVEVQKICAEPYERVSQLLREEQSLRARLESLQKAGTVQMSPRSQRTRLSCSECGEPVMLNTSYCPRCANNLAAVKANYRFCPSCAVYHTGDAVFCSVCGSRTVELPVAKALRHERMMDDLPIQTTQSQSMSSVQKPEVTTLAASSVEKTDETNAPQESSDSETTQRELLEGSWGDNSVSRISFCPLCGAPIESDSLYCTGCGCRLEQ